MHLEAAVGKKLWILALYIVALVGCSGDSTSPTTPSTPPTEPIVTTPTAVMSAEELVAWEADSLAFADRFNANFADAEAVFAGFADDMVIYDPSNGDTFEGKRASVAAWAGFAAGWPDVDARATGLHLSADAAAVLTDVFGLVETADGGPLQEIRLYRFHDGLATTFDLWYRVAGSAHSCFATDACRVEPAELAERYLTAWSSGNEARIGVLYADDSTFADSLLDLQASEPRAIARLHDDRFGSDVEVECTILNLYAQTDGPEPPTESLPDQGQIIAVAIEYRCTISGASRQVALEQVSALWLATRRPDGSFDHDPDGLISSEEVFHDVESLISAGFTP